MAAAQAWLGSLTAGQQTAVPFDVGAIHYTQDQWRDWTNVDGDRDAGQRLQDTSEDQRTKALAVLGAGSCPARHPACA